MKKLIVIAAMLSSLLVFSGCSAQSGNMTDPTFCAGSRFVHNQMVKCHNKPTETFVHGVMSRIKIMSPAQLEGSDVYEIAYARSYSRQFRSKGSLYLSDDENGIKTHSISGYWGYNDER